MTSRRERVLYVASVGALAALGLMCWSLFQPTPLPVMLAMTVGQGVGTLSLLAFLVVVIADLRKPGGALSKRDRGDPPTAG